MLLFASNIYLLGNIAKRFALCIMYSEQIFEILIQLNIRLKIKIINILILMTTIHSLNIIYFVIVILLFLSFIRFFNIISTDKYFDLSF